MFRAFNDDCNQNPDPWTKLGNERTNQIKQWHAENVTKKKRTTADQTICDEFHRQKAR